MTDLNPSKPNSFTSTEATGSFFWGVSTSGYQSEGGFNGTGEPQNNWAIAEKTGRFARTGRAAEFWERYTEDFKLAASLGLNSFRMGIEWARVQPTSDDSRQDIPPPFDDAAIDAYADRIAACREAGLEPVVTLQHFTHPAWLGVDAWLEDRTVRLFAEFVDHVVTRIAKRMVSVHKCNPIGIFITINEPNILVQNTYLTPHFPGQEFGPDVALRAYNRLLAGHVRAYNVIHDIYQTQEYATPLVTTNTFCSDTYWSDLVILDLLSSRENGVTNIEVMFAEGCAALRDAIENSGLPFQSDLFVWLGRLFHLTIDYFAPKFFTMQNWSYFLTTLADSPRARVFDFVGVDYYDPFAGHMFRLPSFRDLEFSSSNLRAHLLDGFTSKWWDWRLLPEGLGFFCKYYAMRYDRPILIAENGMALHRKSDNSASHHRRDGISRSDYLSYHVREVQKLRSEGCPVIGYMHWSMTDNYEWGSYTPRFGLYSIDYQSDAKRVMRDHLGDSPAHTYAKLIRERR